MLDFLFVLFFATSPVITSVVKERTNLCGVNDFACDDGSCINMDLLCLDGAACADGSDQRFCSRNQIPFGQPVITRTKRQTSTCRKQQWQCLDGSCIGFDGKCDGVVDCPDGSDETHPLCRDTQCQSNWFRCTYGACVDGTAACNGKQECADNSDELHPKCFNATDEIQGKFKCQDGQLISSSSRCDGIPDCNDGSDETIRACAAESCPSYLFQCAYGACVDQGSDCNRKNECADGSDESDELCNRISTGTTVAPTVKPSSGACVLPEYPEHGGYTVAGVKYAAPGQRYGAISLNVTCNPGYGVKGKSVILCFNGEWSADMPSCVRFCKLKKHESVEYTCLETENNKQVTRQCEEYEPIGTVVRPSCRSPNYYSPGILSYMRCFEYGWDYVAICKPGLAKNGTNITILIKDKVEVHINDFQYAVPYNDTGAIIFPINQNRLSASPITGTVTPITGNSVEDYINEDDWRMGPGTTTVKPNYSTNSIMFIIKNSTVIINDDKIHFRDN